MTAPTYELAKIPDSVSYEVAASALCGALTAYEAIERKANLYRVGSCWCGWCWEYRYPTC